MEVKPSPAGGNRDPVLQTLPGKKLVGWSQTTQGVCVRVGGVLVHPVRDKGEEVRAMLPVGLLDLASCLQSTTQPSLSPDSPPMVIVCCSTANAASPPKSSIQMLS